MVPPEQGPKIRIPPVQAEKKSRRKLSGSLLALSAAAITSIYTVGYVSTQASVDKLASDASTAVATVAATQPAQRTSTTNASPTSPAPTIVASTPTPATAGSARSGSTNTTVPSSPTSTPATTTPPTTSPATATTSPAPTKTASPTPTTGYKDGSYVAVGSSRHGNIEVTVVIQNGKIVSASVSNCATRYPCSDVAPLVKSVVSQQAVPASHVSGATDSSNAYKTAVAKALSLAKQG